MSNFVNSMSLERMGRYMVVLKNARYPLIGIRYEGYMFRYTDVRKYGFALNNLGQLREVEERETV